MNVSVIISNAWCTSSLLSFICFFISSFVFIRSAAIDKGVNMVITNGTSSFNPREIIFNDSKCSPNTPLFISKYLILFQSDFCLIGYSILSGLLKESL